MALEPKLNFWHEVGQMGRRVGRNSTLVLRLGVVASEKVELRSTGYLIGFENAMVFL